MSVGICSHLVEEAGLAVSFAAGGAQALHTGASGVAVAAGAARGDRLSAGLGRVTCQAGWAGTQSLNRINSEIAMYW